jgi:hypothetical protein
MKLNIYQKLHKAACEAGGVAKGKKVPGMHFNPLQHDEVQRGGDGVITKQWIISYLYLH